MIAFQLASGKYPPKITRDVAAFGRLLPEIALAFNGIPWQLKKPKTAGGDIPRKPKHIILIHIISDSVMKKLNSKYRQKADTTDVLSFSALEGGIPVFPHEPVGEIFISHAQAVRQAREYAGTLKHELCVLTVHGALHILGYDHERSAPALKTMQRAEKKILGRVAGVSPKKAGIVLPGLTAR